MKNQHVALLMISIRYNYAKNCNDIVCYIYCVSILSLVKFSSVYYNYFILALLPVSGE